MHILGTFPPQTNEEIIPSNLWKKIAGIGTGVFLKIYRNLGRNIIFNKLTRPTGVRGNNLHAWHFIIRVLRTRYRFSVRNWEIEVTGNLNA